MHNDYLPNQEDIKKLLKSVKDPQTDTSIYELGLIKSVDYIEKEKKIIVVVDFLRRNPSCVGCLPIAWMVQKSITDKLYKLFSKYDGIDIVEFIDQQSKSKPKFKINKIN